MRHAILGAGAIGGLIGAALARTGIDVVRLVRSETLAGYEGPITVESVVLGDFQVDVPASSQLADGADVLWVTVKATRLASALELAPPEHVDHAAVIALMNGVDHIGVLRARYENVVAGAIRVESERLGPNHIRQLSPFLRVDLAGAEPVVAQLQAAGIDARLHLDEVSLLWETLVFLAPVALATTSAIEAARTRLLRSPVLLVRTSTSRHSVLFMRALPPRCGALCKRM